MKNATCFFLLMIYLVIFSCQPRPAEQSPSTPDADTLAVADSTMTGTVVSTYTDPYAEFTPDSGIPMRKVPEKNIAVKFKGIFSEAYSWKDNNGINLIILSFQDKQVEVKDTDITESTSEIFVRQYVRADSVSPAKLLWELYDLEKDCPYDITLNFLDMPYVTDLDKNGSTETTLVYKASCRSDVSPSYMKIIMREGARKYALRGVMILPQGEEEINIDTITQWNAAAAGSNNDNFIPGLYETEADFETAPAEFLSFVQQLWKDYVVEEL